MSVPPQNKGEETGHGHPAENLHTRPEISLGVRAFVNTPLMHILECCDKIKGPAGSNAHVEPDQLEKIRTAAQHLLLWLNTPEGQTEHFRKSVSQSGLQSILTHPLPQPDHRSGKGQLLIVDDNLQNLEILQLLLTQQGYKAQCAENGHKALAMIEAFEFDLVLLDILMPELDGYAVLTAVKQNPRLKNVPIIMISGLDEIENVIKCIELGAEDFVPKPFNPVLLRAKIDACLEKKRWRDQDRANLLRLRAEQEKSESLLLNILPKPIADRLKAGESTIVDAFADVTVLFADLVEFTNIAGQSSPTEVVKCLNEIFSEFDRLVDLHQLEKIKTIGDAYMAVGGVPTEKADHAEAVVQFALDMQQAIARINVSRKSNLQLRIGVASGPVMAGIIGRRKFIYDLWGDTVNSASRMESLGRPGGIQITETTYQKISAFFICQELGLLEVKGKGPMAAYLVLKKKE